MPNKLSRRSKAKYDTLHPDLQLILDYMLDIVDFSVIEGVRTKERQRELVESGMSKTMRSKHLANKDGVSEAVDIVPYPGLDWNDRERFTFYQGIAKGIAHMLYIMGDIDHTIRNGVDWDGDGNIKEHSFFDGPHLELKKGK
jgi:peptidoglycan L-alanyl-D-glutamate endopeptidase CwlK